MSRLLIVSNRLPITLTRTGGALQVRRSSGGLATGLSGAHERLEGLWIGWPGEADTTPAERTALELQLEELRTVPVWLQADAAIRFYEGFSNGVLWPLFHYLPDRMPLHVRDWDAYEQVNEHFADVIATHYRPGDLVWIHDYHLMLVPDLLRTRLPTARIGFFLHIPFPSSEVFRVLPERERILRGVLGADLVGFHTAAYMRHFASSLLRLCGLATDLDRVQVANREVRLGIFPMGIDAAYFAALANDPEVASEVRALRGSGATALLVGIDRLDYTKGIPRRLMAFEVLLRRYPDLRERVRLIQVAVPSRTNVTAYRTFRQQLEGLVGRVNGKFGTPHWNPVHYVSRSLSAQELVALYRAADVMLVTPVRDGMNLVAKEFIAARTDEDGVLVLSELAGASAELAESLLANPYDIDRTAEVIHRALSLQPEERRARMQALRKRVFQQDVHRWVTGFLAALEDAGAVRDRRVPALTPDVELRAVLRRMREASYLILLLDYDGTLVPFAPAPDLAIPDENLHRLLRALAARPNTEVHVVSGRARESAERWLGALPIGLHVEHGLWSRQAPGEEWKRWPVSSAAWHDRARDILEQFAMRTPGSLVEEKSAALAWHYRMTDPELGARQANELRLHLTELLSNAPVEILTGEKVIEVRTYGPHKGVVVPSLLERMPPRTLIVAFGDDRTDEDLFAALPPDAVSVHVGPTPSRAQIRIAGVDDARRLLGGLLEGDRPAND